MSPDRSRLLFYNMNYAVEVSELRKSYGDHVALDGLSLRFPQGRITGFLGPNGAGKTTTFRSVLGLTTFDSGRIRVLDGQVPTDLPELTKRIGAIVEEPGLIKALTGRANLRVAAETLGFGHDRIDGLLEFVGLADDARRRVGDYSKGMRQRLALAGALLGDPEMLLLDEPLDGRDPSGQKSLRARLRDLADDGRTIVISSHVLADIEALADHVVVIDKGRTITSGALEDILGSASTKVEGVQPGAARSILEAAGFRVTQEGETLVVSGEDGAAVTRALSAAGIYPRSVSRYRRTLEQVFLGITEEGDG